MITIPIYDMTILPEVTFFFKTKTLQYSHRPDIGRGSAGIF